MDRSRLSDLTSQFFRHGVLLIGVVALTWLSWQVRDILLLTFAGLLLAIFFHILVRLLRRLVPLSNQVALLIVVLALFSLLGLLSWFLAPHLLQDVNALFDNIPVALRQLTSQVDQSGWMQRLLDQLPPLAQVVPTGGLLSRVTGTFSTALALLANILLVFFVGLFLTSDPTTYREGLLHLVPVPRRPRMEAVMDEVGTTLRWWLLGQLFSMSVIGVLTGVGLWLLGIPFALTLGVMTGLLEFIPYVGPVVAGALAALLAFTQNPIQALYVVALYIGIQQFEGSILTPLVHQYTVSLPPALTLVAVLAIGSLFGFVGLVVATPLLAVIIVLVKLLYIEDVLDETPELPRKLFQRKS